MPEEERFRNGPSLRCGFSLFVGGELLGLLVQVEYPGLQEQFDKESNKKIKRTATWGKYTKSAYGARRYGGWTTSGLLRFNELFE